MKHKKLVQVMVISLLISIAVLVSADKVTSLNTLKQGNEERVNSDASENRNNNLNGFVIVKPIPEVVPFGVGEKLVFGLQYGIIYAGKASLEVRNIAILDSVKSYHIFSIARSNKAFDFVFKVRDHHESFIDYENFYSLRFKKHIREGTYRKDEFVDFDQKKHLAVYKDKKIRIAPNTQDFLSAFYYIRTISLIPGQAILLANHSGKKNYPIYVKVLRKEKVSVPAGDFKCVVIEPVLKTSSIFKQKGKLTIWLTDDIVKMPVLMRSKVLVGFFEAQLKEYKLSEEEPRVPGISKRVINVK
jgi:hypothetical protein